MVNLLEDDKGLQERVLGVHHAFMSTLLSRRTVKMIENKHNQAFSLIWSAQP